MRKIIFAAGMMSLLAACGNTGNTQTTAVDDTQNYDERKADSLGIPKGNKLSAAMKRAMKWENHDNKWFFEYKMEPLKGDLAYEEGVVRRDPSAMLKIGDTYYVWYSKRLLDLPRDLLEIIEKDKVFPWDRCDIWICHIKGWIDMERAGNCSEAW